MMEYFRIKQDKNILASLIRRCFYYNKIIFIIFFIIFSVALMVFDIKGNINIKQMKHWTQFQLLELVQYFYWISNPINNLTNNWNCAYNLQYSAFLKNTYMEDANFKKLLNENKHLKNLLHYLETNEVNKRQYVSTRIITNIDSTYGFIKLGSNNGIQNNQAVMNEFGLIGKVTEVTETYAKIIFITDSNCRILSKTAESGYKIITAGGYGKHLKMLYLADGAKLKVNEIIVTTADFNFPADIQIGTIDSNNEIVPVVDLNNIDLITIIM